MCKTFLFLMDTILVDPIFKIHYVSEKNCITYTRIWKHLFLKYDHNSMIYYL